MSRVLSGVARHAGVAGLLGVALLLAGCGGDSGRNESELELIPADVVQNRLDKLDELPADLATCRLIVGGDGVVHLDVVGAVDDPEALSRRVAELLEVPLGQVDLTLVTDDCAQAH